MFAVDSRKSRGVPQADAELANSFISGVENTLSRTRGAAANANTSAIALGQAYELGRLFDRAAQAYAKAVDHENADVAREALARYVITMLKADRRREALRSAKRLAALDPEYTVTSVVSGETYSSMTLLGDAMFVNGQLEDAEKAYNAALKTLPKDPFVSGRLALLLMSTGRSKEAVKLIDAVAQSPRHTEILNTLNLVKSGLIVARVDAASAVAAVAESAVGRPFRVEESRTATLVERGDWS